MKPTSRKAAVVVAKIAEKAASGHLPKVAHAVSKLDKAGRRRFAHGLAWSLRKDPEGLAVYIREMTAVLVRQAS